MSKVLAGSYGCSASGGPLPCSNRCCRPSLDMPKSQSSVGWLQPGSSWWRGPGARSAVRRLVHHAGGDLTGNVEHGRAPARLSPGAVAHHGMSHPFMGL